MIIVRLPVGALQTNCYIVGCPETREGAVIDPGGQAHLILAEVERRGLTIKYVLNTHGHFDHTDANRAVVAATGAPLLLHPADNELLKDLGGAGWFDADSVPSPAADSELQDGDELHVGTLHFRVLHIPGHTPGHVCFYEPHQGVLFDGDVLFQRGIGRADLPGGDELALFASIRNVLFALPDETIVYPGHGMPTTIGEEKRLNPWRRFIL